VEEVDISHCSLKPCRVINRKELQVAFYPSDVRTCSRHARGRCIHADAGKVAVKSIMAMGNMISDAQERQ
jgi:hypothetical protein